MPKSCSVVGCNAKPVNDETIHFFRFPIRDEEKLEKWLEVVKRKDWVPTVNSRICSKHFSKQDIFYKGFSQKSCLKQTAIPITIDLNKSTTLTNEDYKSLYFSAIKLKSVKDAVIPEAKVQQRSSLQNISNEKSNGNAIKTYEKSSKPKERRDAMGRALLKKILPAPCKIVKKEEVKKVIKEQSCALKVSNLERKIKRQNVKIEMMKDLLTEVMKRNNKIMKEVTAHMRKKKTVDTELLILLQNHLSSIQRLETNMKATTDHNDKDSEEFYKKCGSGEKNGDAFRQMQFGLSSQRERCN